MKKYLVFIGLAISLIAQGQSEKESSTISIGTEVDVLPFLTGGYYGSIWVSKDHFRYRAIVTNVTTPEFMLEDGFTNNEMNVYALVADYFFEPSVEKWWIGAGVEYWDGSIQTDALTSTSHYNNFIFTVGGGFVWKFYKNFYVNPWAAVHLRMAGDTSVAVDDKIFEPAFFTPEASVKIGWYFNTRK